MLLSLQREIATREDRRRRDDDDDNEDALSISVDDEKTAVEGAERVRELDLE